MKNVVFDTNAYRTFVRGKDFDTIYNEVKSIKQLEYKAGYLPCINTHVSWELLKHLKDSQSRDYDSCRKALWAQYFHCSIENSKHFLDVQVFTIPFKMNAILKYLGIQESKRVSNIQAETIDLVKLVNTYESQYWPSEIYERLEMLQDIFDDYRRVIMKELNTELLEIFDKESTDELISSLKTNKILRSNSSKTFRSTKFDDFITNGYVQIAKDSGYKEPFAPQEFDVLKGKIKPAIEFLRKFYKYTIDGLPQSGQKILQTDTNSRWNTFIDLEIIGETLFSNSLLVTNEINIIDAYKECGKKNLVFTNNEYFQHIGLSR